MKKLIATAIIAATLSVIVGCSWWNGGGGAVVANQGEQEMGCLLAQVMSGNVDPVSVAVACTGALLSDIVKDIEAILASYTQPAPAPDGGATPAVVGSMTFAPGTKPPYTGAPTWLSMKVIADLRAMRDQSKAAIAAGAK